MRLLSALTVSLFVAFLSGCKQNEIVIGGVPREKQYRTIASLSPSTTEIVASNALLQKLVGRTAACNYPELQVKEIEVVAGVKPDYEKLKSIQPGLIVYDAQLYNEADVQKIQELGFDTFAFKATTIDAFCKELLAFGAMVGAESNCSSYVDRIRLEKLAAEGDPITPKPKVVLLMPGQDGRHLIAGLGSFQADIVRATGSEILGPNAEIFVPANIEQIIAWNPDAIVTAGSPDPIVTDARLKSVNAVKNNRVFGVDQDTLVREGNRVDTAIKLVYKGLAQK